MPQQVVAVVRDFWLLQSRMVMWSMRERTQEAEVVRSSQLRIRREGRMGRERGRGWDAALSGSAGRGHHGRARRKFACAG